MNHGVDENDGPRELHASEFTYRFDPTCMVCPLAPSVNELSFTAAEVRTTQQWLTSKSVRESLHISSGFGRLSVGGVLVRTTGLLAGARYALVPPSLNESHFRENKRTFVDANPMSEKTCRYLNVWLKGF